VISVENCQFFSPHVFNASTKGVLLGILAVQTQYCRVTDIQPSFDGKDRPYALCCAGNIGLVQLG